MGGQDRVALDVNDEEKGRCVAEDFAPQLPILGDVLCMHRFVKRGDGGLSIGVQGASRSRFA